MKKVIVAMSGGIDSSITAYLLKKQGYNIIGIFMRLRIPISSKKIKTSQAEIVKKICQKLNIKFKAIDLTKQFKKYVIDYFINEYKNGLTPNPCIMCNKYIKFGFLFNYLKKLNADYLATGHYARIKKQKTPCLPAGRENRKQFELLRARDKSKDQSYFLYNLNQKRLAKILFPIGDYLKSDIKNLAKKLNLPVNKSESQDLCFISEKQHNQFLKKYLKPKSGKIININSNKKIGEHAGLPFYTLGQRKGIGLANPKPYYVVGLDYSNNILQVSDNAKDPQLFSKKLIIKKLNLIGDIPLPRQLKIKIRYRHQPAKAEIKKINNTSLLAHFQFPQRAIMPGQSAVIYDNNQVIGGGVIAKEELIE